MPKQRIIRSLSFFLLLAVSLCLPAQEQQVELVIEGVRGELRDNVLASLSIERQRAHPALTGARIRVLHARAPEEIRAALQPFGYYRPEISSELRDDAEVWVARYSIAPGPRMRVEQVDIRLAGAGRNDPEFVQTVRELPIAQGRFVDHQAYDEAKRSLQRIAARRGYLDGVFTVQQLRVDLQAYQASVVLHFDTGPRYLFGPVRFEQDILNPEFVARFVPFDEGQPYTSTELLELQAALSDSEYFRAVDVRPRRDLAEDLLVPIDVELTPRPRQRYVVGIGYGTDTGARGRLGWEHRRVNRRGHQFTADLRASEILTNLTARYVIPGTNPRTDRYDFTATWQDESDSIVVSETLRLVASYSHLRGNWRETFSLTYLDERFTVGDDRDSSVLWMPGSSWTRTWADDRIYTTRGGQVSFDLRGASDELGSDTSFLQGRVHSVLIRPVSSRSRALLRGEVGASAVDQFAQLPASVRFFAGGDQSVRGYAYRSLGPRDDSGQVVGGRNLLVGSAEYEYAIRGNWSAAVFYDVGNAVDDFGDPLRHGAGLGVRWRTPIGLVRADVASALSLPGNPWRLHLRIGPDL